MADADRVQIEFYDQQDRVSVNLATLQGRTQRALPLVRLQPGPHPSTLGETELLEFTLVDDVTISRVHGEFLNDPTPTDVITFHHGEILISVDTAARQAEAFEQTLEHELLLYAIHGLLHLHGHDDHTPAEAETMRLLQESILKEIT